MEDYRDDCPCGCYGDPGKCVWLDSNVCAACGLEDCPCGCEGDPDECVCDVQVRWNPTCEKCGLADCECQKLGYCVCENRRNPDPDGKPWGPSLYNPLHDNFHEFKDDSSYRDMSSRYRRNPRIDIRRFM